MNVFSFIGNQVKKIDSELQYYSPIKLIVLTATSIIALQTFAKYCQGNWDESTRDHLGRWAKKIPSIRHKYEQDIRKQFIEFQEKTRESWKEFGEPVFKIPDKGWNTQQLIDLINKYSTVTNNALRNKHYSGTIYSKSFVEKETEEKVDKEKSKMVDGYTDIAKRLQAIFTLAYKKAYLWNSLHQKEFGIGTFIEYQVVRMVADMFGGNSQDVMGFVTSGGTESLMLAARAYRNWGIKERNHEPGEAVIVAGNSVHAAVIKASSAYFIKVILIDTDEQGNIDMEQLQSAMKKYGKKVIALIGSAPSYPKGTVDNIKKMATIARQYGCGMHVDCCLGGFVINFGTELDTDFLKIPGVTSLSVDTHKNGWAPKGSSVLVTRKLGHENLAYHSIYAIPGWTGGVYGTPKDSGSQTCVPAFTALLAMLAIGKNGYRKIAKDIISTTAELAEIVNSFKNQLVLVKTPQVNVVAFKVDKRFIQKKGATYALAHEMSKQRFILNTLKDDAVHYCVTGRSLGDDTFLQNFKSALTNSLEKIKTLNTFTDDAGMYCALESAMNPKIKEQKFGDYIGNLLLGNEGAKDAVKMYFLAQLDAKWHLRDH